MSPRQPVEVRLSDATGWDSVFRLLAMERWRAFLPQMGVPEQIAAQPDALCGCARNYLVQRRAIETPVADSVVVYLSRLSDVLDTTFDCISSAYGQRVADEFAAWSRRSAVDSDSESSLFVWGALLRMLCADDPGHDACPPPDTELVRRICPEVKARLDPAEMREIRTRLSAARREPTTAYEDELNAEVLRAAGDGPNVMNAVELAAELVESAVRSERTLRMWRAVALLMEAGDSERLLAWARCRAEAEGMPAPTKVLGATGP